MERVTEQEQTMEVFENDIQLYLSMFCDENGIEDMAAESQSRWNGALRYIRKHVFADKEILKSKSNINIYNNNIPSNFNAYNYDIVNDICDIYIDMCFNYDKEISIIGFSNLTGITNEVISLWGNNEQRLSTTSFEIYKKLTTYREESLSNKLATGKQNPVGVIAILNRQYGWASPYTADSNRQKRALTDAELPRLSGGNCAENANNSMIDSDDMSG